MSQTATVETGGQSHPESKTEVVSTHVLVEAEKVEQLRELSRKTRVHQSEYLREAVDDLLEKYQATGEDE
jgi:hypothetical protein